MKTIKQLQAQIDELKKTEKTEKNQLKKLMKKYPEITPSNITEIDQEKIRIYDQIIARYDDEPTKVFAHIMSDKQIDYYNTYIRFRG